jgi:hypothetical protein
MASGGLIQDMFPEFSDSEREVLLSGLTDQDFERFTKG